jgi:IS605 OrfB family transposase
VPSLGELSRRGERGPTTPAIPGEGIYPIQPTNRRTIIVRLLPNGAQERKLRRLADATAKLWNELNHEMRRLYGKLVRRLLHLYRNFAKHLIEQLHELGVSTIYLGYPFNIAQQKGNKFTVNLWSYRKLMEAIELKAQEYGIRVFIVIEYNTSRYCAYHNVEVKRQPRGVVHCPKGHKLHSDLNGALNIMKKATGKIPQVIRKPLSFIVDHNQVTPTKREVTTKTPTKPALKGGKGVSLTVISQVKNKYNLV